MSKAATDISSGAGEHEESGAANAAINSETTPTTAGDAKEEANGTANADQQHVISA